MIPSSLTVNHQSIFHSRCLLATTEPPSFPSENHMTLPSKRKSSDLPQTLTATGTQEKQGEQPREQPRGTGLSTHVTARAYTFPVTSCKSLDLKRRSRGQECGPVRELNCFSTLFCSNIVKKFRMANIAIKRVQREFKEVIKSEEVCA